MKHITIGSHAPVFTLKDQDATDFNLQDIIGKKNIVLFFYPKDDTPGCVKEACYFRDQYEVFKDADAEVIGISGQSVKSHKNFANKYRLTYRLLSDTGNKIRNTFGIPAKLLGLLPGRVTYIIDKNGVVVYTFDSQYEATKHVDEALRILNEINQKDQQ